MTDLAARVRAAAVLEGDFVLRSGRRSRYYVDKYRFGTRPDLLAEIGDALAARIAEVEPGAVRIGAPEVGAIALAAAASLTSGLPFIIVRKAPKEYGTSKRLEGVFEVGERVVVVEDGIKHGGIASTLSEMFREEGLTTSIHSIGIPLQYLEHAKRNEILQDLGITAQQISRELVAWNSSQLTTLEKQGQLDGSESHKQKS